MNLNLQIATVLLLTSCATERPITIKYMDSVAPNSDHLYCFRETPTEFHCADFELFLKFLKKKAAEDTESDEVEPGILPL